MEFSNKSYFTKLLGISSELGGVEACFKNEKLEKQFREANLEKNVKKSNVMNFSFFLFFAMALYHSIRTNGALITEGYFLIAGILVDLGLAQITRYFYKNYKMFKLLKITRFLLCISMSLWSGYFIQE
jgi:hypothetical protein